MTAHNVFADTVMQFLAPVRPLLDDASVSEIMINGPHRVYFERAGRIERANIEFSGHKSLLAALRNIAQFVGKHVDELNPILEGRLPDGSRIEAVLPPAAPDGPHVSIRRFFKETLTVERLISLGAMTPLSAAALQVMVAAKVNTIVVGGTGSGKTSMLNALSSFVPDGERIIVIEDSKEVQLQREHVVQLEARPPDPRGRGQVTIRDLFRATLRMRPDRVIIGEIRGGEALDIVQAMTSGHGGCMGTLHATHSHDTLTRLETMAMMSDVVMPLAALRMQIGSGIQLVVEVTRLQDGTRRLTSVSEIAGFDQAAQAYRVNEIFAREYHGVDENGMIRSELVPTGKLPTFIPQLQRCGLDLPPALYDIARVREDA